MINITIRRSFIGLGFTAIVTFIALSIMVVQGVEASVSDIWKNMLGSMLMGVYFGIASLLYDIESWSPLKQTLIHFLLSIFIWLPLALYLGWVPFDVESLFIATGLFILSYAMFWFGTCIYFLKLEKEMNNSIKK
ncbi:Protein of unknown function [Salinibacillus kushneri]|uniref:DUF3021 domain-containing protein n=1 Tax=Salinibacillus kushneri TaxID=237682 RepID=A0A1I0EZL7_9BACI|nr:DUF3021 domain-containing protein [Salinibacillus kushneri]SET50969.1 Protein of unknown function [Salinibacillus kushneri]